MKQNTVLTLATVAIVAVVVTTRSSLSQSEEGSPSMKDSAPGTVIFEEGHFTEPVDRGRPVILIAAALGVAPEIFRDAFRGVSPAHGGPPSPQLAQANKRVLMNALGKHGITNDRLDTVSNYYRYRPESGKLWKHKPAKAIAVIQNDKVVDVRLLDAGSGYTKPPRVSITGFPDLEIKSTVEFSRDMNLNGRIGSLTIATSELPSKTDFPPRE